MNPGWTPALLFQTAVWLGLSLWVLTGLSAPADVPATFGLGLLGVALETLAVRWPHFGFSSAAPACYLGIALLPGLPAGWGVVFCCLGLCLRSMLRPASGLVMNLREITASALPVVLALAAARGLGNRLEDWLGVLVVDVYLPSAFLAPAALAADLPGPAEAAWRRVRAKTVLSWLSIGFLAVPLATLRSLWLVPVLFGLQRSCRSAVESVREEEQQRLSQELEQSRRSEHRARQQVSEVRKELEVKLEERVLFEELARQFAQAPDLASTRQATVQMALRLVPSCCSAVLFEAEEDVLIPVAILSPQRKRVESARLLQLAEPIVTQAWHQQRPVALTKNSPDRLFPEESGAVALPVPGSGILYVGGYQPGLSLDQPQVGLLRLLVQQAGEALQAALRYQQLESRASEHDRLRQEVSQLSHLLAACVTLSESLQAGAILAALETEVQAVVPHQSCKLIWGTISRGPDLPQALWNAVVTQQRPLLIEDVTKGKLPALMPEERSLLAVPLGPEGLIALGARPESAFTREHLECLQVLALQARLNLHNADLVRQIRESEAQLVQSSKMAAVGQLAAGVAHEINTPLAAMMLAIQGAMASKSLPENLKNMLGRAEKAGQRARDIIHKLLYYSRDARVGRRRVQLELVLKDTLDLVGHQLLVDQVKVGVEAAPTGDVLVNENELQQVLTNLLMNARDAVLSEPQAPREVKVRVYPRGEQACLEVWDQGPGVPEEHQSKIFDPFFTTKPVGQGTGLGLSVSLQLVQSHGGQLEYQPLVSPDRRGSCFRLTLPLAAQDDDPPERTDPGADPNPAA